jgi:hypothetical protein
MKHRQIVRQGNEKGQKVKNTSTLQNEYRQQADISRHDICMQKK